jgi:hypothetical protein
LAAINSEQFLELDEFQTCDTSWDEENELLITDVL